jgi:acetyltransferase
MTANPLATILAPRSIAVVGASNNPLKMGTIQFLNLRHSGFPGKVWPVHPREKAVFGLEAFPSIEALPEAPDLALLVVPGRLVAGMIEAFGRRGTRHAVVITAGFGETGPEGRRREEDLKAAAARHGLRFLGPNCMGLVNTRLPLNVTAAPLVAPPGHLGLISQSGTYITQTLHYLNERGVRLSQAVSVGNEADIDLVDGLEHLGADPETRAIGLYIESLRRPEAFLAAARRITPHKPIVAQYVGGSAAGARAGSSHTAALAGPDAVVDGLFRQAGIIRARSIEEVYRLGAALADQPPLRGRRVAILTNSGGPGTAMADTLDRLGMEVPPFGPALKAAIQAHLPDHASAGNPVDLTFHTDMTLMAETLPALLMAADEVDGLLIHGIMDTGWADLAYPVFQDLFQVSRDDFRKNFRADIGNLVALPARWGKPLVVSSFFGREDRAVRGFQAAGVPVFDGPEKAAAAMAALLRHPRPPEAEGEASATEPLPAEVQALVAAVAREGWNEHTAKRVLAALGVPTCREALVPDAVEAAAAAREIGFPVAVKGCAAHLAHKSELGLVHLNLATEEAVRAACAAVHRAAPGVGLLVCEMVAGEREFLAGFHRPPGFPPAVIFGLGGVWAEALRDQVVRLAPLSAAEARAQIGEIRAAAALGAFRGLPPVDRDAVAAVLVALGRLAAACPELAEVDVNPLVIRQGRPVVVDALFVAGRG